MENPLENVVNTADPEYQNRFNQAPADGSDDWDDEGDTNEDYSQRPIPEVGDDNDDYGAQGDEDEDLTDPNDGGGQQGQATGNETLDAYISWAKERGIDVDPAKFDKEKFDEKQMDKLVQRHYAAKYFGGVDPKFIDMAENGVNMDQYMQYRQQMTQVLNQEPERLYQSNLWNHLLQQESALGTIAFDEKGQFKTQEMQQYMYKQFEERLKLVNPDIQKQQGMALKQQYQKQLDALPDHLIEEARKVQQQEVTSYNKEVEGFLDVFKKNISKLDSFVTVFSSQAEKDEYVEYMKSQLTISGKDGKTQVPLYDRLENDEQFLAKILRLAYLLDNGAFTDLSNKERNAAFKSLSVTPVLKKGQGTPKQGNIANTADPEYQKKYKR